MHLPLCYDRHHLPSFIPLCTIHSSIWNGRKSQWQQREDRGYQWENPERAAPSRARLWRRTSPQMIRTPHVQRPLRRRHARIRAGAGGNCATRGMVPMARRCTVSSIAHREAWSRRTTAFADVLWPAATACRPVAQSGGDLRTAAHMGEPPDSLISSHVCATAQAVHGAHRLRRAVVSRMPPTTAAGTARMTASFTTSTSSAVHTTAVKPRPCLCEK